MCLNAVANGHLSWLIWLLDKTLCSTPEGDTIVTDYSAAYINYKDFETKQVRRSFICQFYPELLEDLRAVGTRPTHGGLR